MIQVRKATERGHFDHGWLDTYHTFSFADYYDPAHLGFRSLRVINDDRVAPGQGFGTHGHRDMEIVTYVLEGALEHRDSLGNAGIIPAGQLQRMTAGTGVRHSEFNPSAETWTHLYQIWLLPERKGLAPSYEQLAVDDGATRGRLQLVASPEGENGSLRIHQDARLYLASARPEMSRFSRTAAGPCADDSRLTLERGAVCRAVLSPHRVADAQARHRCVRYATAPVLLPCERLF
jgi:quercetin 2,3-dioxygenase